MTSPDIKRDPSDRNSPPPDWLDEPRPGEHEAYVFHVLFGDDPSAQKTMHEPGFPVLHRFTEDTSCK